MDALGGANHQVPADGQSAEHISDGDLFRVTIKIDEHVANEDTVTRRLRQRFNQVMSLEFDELLDLRTNMPQVGIRSDAESTVAAACR